MASEQSHADQDQLLQRQVRELYGNSNASSLAVVVIATFLTWILWLVADQLSLLGWYIYTLVLTAIRTLATIRYKRAETSAGETRYWLKVYVAGVFLSGLGWGWVILFIVPIESTYYVVCTLLLVCGLVTGSAGTLASLKYGFATFAIPALLPGAFYLILQNRPETLVAGFSVCLYLLFIAVIALRIHRIIIHSITKQFASAKLVVEMTEINQELTARYAELEKELMRSTRTILDLRNKLKQKEIEYSLVSEMKDLISRDNKFKPLLDKLHGGLWDYNLKTGDIRFSPQWLNMLGYNEGEFEPHVDFWKSLLHPDDKATVINRLGAHADGVTPEFVSSHRMKSRDGQWTWVFSRGQAVIWDKYGASLNMICAEINIADPEVHWNGKLDSVYFNASEWLYSETRFGQRLQYALQTTALENIEHAMCHIAFFRVNAGDAMHTPLETSLVLQISNILVKECRHGDAVVNLGNNSFAILLENCPVDKAMEKARSLQDIVSGHRFHHDSGTIQIGSCVGISPISQAHESASDTLEDAARACSMAREAALENIHVYQRDNAESDPDILEAMRQAKIQEVLENKRLQLIITPLKLLTTPGRNPTRIFWLDARLPGFQNYPSGSIRLHVQEDANSLTIACDICTIEMFYAWSMVQRLAYTDQKNIYIFECAESSILDEKFLSHLQSLSENNTPTRHLLCLGIPERTFAAHTDSVLQFIAALKPKGFTFALTGFGSANLSLDYMRRLPADYLKLDEALLRNIDTDKSAFLTVKYLNEISHVLNFKTIAVSADGELLQEKLRDVGTDYIQDFISGQSPLLAAVKGGGLTH